MHNKLILEYLWLDCNQHVRYKTRIVNANDFFTVDNVEPWNFDGSSTGQAPFDGNTEVILKPRKMFRDPLRIAYSNTNKNCYLVLCDTYDSSGTPLPTNTRHNANLLFEKYENERPLFGLEQEYFLFFKNKSSGDLDCSTHYCGSVSNYSERQIAEEHMEACLNAGLTISGINAEVVEGQWEFQIGPCYGISAADELTIARYLLEKIAEKYNALVCYNPKPILNKNGSGCHINFSTQKTLSENGIEEIYKCIKRLEVKHKEHIEVYGKGNRDRLTGIHETSSYSKFTYGIGTRNTSVRIPNQTFQNGFGYFEDRRPASNIDPYLATSKLFETCCVHEKDDYNI